MNHELLGGHADPVRSGLNRGVVAGVIGGRFRYQQHLRHVHFDREVRGRGGHLECVDQAEHVRRGSSRLPQVADVLRTDELRTVARLGGVHRTHRSFPLADVGLVDPRVQVVNRGSIDLPNLRIGQVLRIRYGVEGAGEFYRWAGAEPTRCAALHDVVQELDILRGVLPPGELRPDEFRCSGRESHLADERVVIVQRCQVRSNVLLDGGFAGRCLDGGESSV